jgi:UDP-N-acetyl-D-mannosaminouronate:lipid I N-acetyl-D-mannosaminouronosyltransferase
MKSAANDMANVSIAGIDVSGFSSVESCAKHLAESARNGSGGAAFAINAEKVVSAIENPALGPILREGTLRYPDGAGVVLAMRRKGVVSARGAGADLWLAVMRRACSASLHVALIGARPDVLQETRRRLGIEFPDAPVVLAVDGYQGAKDLESVAAQLVSARPALVMVAMGSPRQEQVILELRREYPAGVYLGLGGSFDVYCGRKKRAPLWMQRIGLEWLFRFLVEPSRAGRERKRLKFLLLLLAGRV